MAKLLGSRAEAGVLGKGGRARGEEQAAPQKRVTNEAAGRAGVGPSGKLKM